ncbi:MAG TPA: hypothetical protein VN880_01675 [Solirubrobacteraceae bacterium]|jgi:hypothetical protein|nr:hypothetical protein [Solirubrobacteraceae bacterium]
MSEESMVELVQGALRDAGVQDEVIAVGQFYPRGHTGGLFAGGLIGGDAGGVVGNLGGAIGTAGGSIAGMHAADRASGLPGQMLVGVSENTVYGFAAKSRRKLDELVFKVDRAGLTAKVHQRVNVRVLELIDDDSGARIELEGNRMTVTHAKDVIKVLTG